MLVLLLNEPIRDDPMFQVMLRLLERVAGDRTGPVARGSVTEQLRSNRAELFRGVTEVAPIVAEHWVEPIKGIMNDLNGTPA